MKYLLTLTEEIGFNETFVIIEQSNRSANALYGSVGGGKEPTNCYIFG